MFLLVTVALTDADALDPPRVSATEVGATEIE
jgi:hypothetical protein